MFYIIRILSRRPKYLNFTLIKLYVIFATKVSEIVLIVAKHYFCTFIYAAMQLLLS